MQPMRLSYSPLFWIRLELSCDSPVYHSINMQVIRAIVVAALVLLALGVSQFCKRLPGQVWL